jgi:putative PIN family toxin of toxin-antitoxin system
VIALFDTNVLIAALVTEGICSKLLHRARKKEFLLLTCPFIISEVQRVLSKKFHASKKDVADAVSLILDTAEYIEHAVKVPGACRDADDDNIIACAIAAKAEYLVTGDADLLEMKSCRGSKIVSPRDFELLFD